jgi:hypothetical protein
MEFSPIKRGRKVIGVKLIWGRKDSAERIEALKELERPRVGRKVRRTGTIEALATEQAQLRATMAEELAAAPQQGRKARITGTVEDMLPPEVIEEKERAL